jgi:hypothetical protein
MQEGDDRMSMVPVENVGNQPLRRADLFLNFLVGVPDFTVLLASTSPAPLQRLGSPPEMTATLANDGDGRYRTYVEVDVSRVNDLVH